jgi:8-oxo-dGTP pyrophosphatase MutT (NUDIX family)
MRTRVDPAWLAALRAAADVPPVRPRVPLRLAVDGAVIGSVELPFLQPVAGTRLPGGALLLDNDPATGWSLHGEPTASLALLASALRDAGLAHVWRDEQLTVADEAGRAVATVERAVVRCLGITTHAVHLVGLAPDGRTWLQQRAYSKPNDPGLWDTLMGGMVAARDTLEAALERETWEEAGLVLDQLEGLHRGGRITTRRPSSDGGGAGYVIEHIDWFRCQVPAGVAPKNQDGEVEQFALVHADEVALRMQRGEFTAEAALILCEAL